MLGDSPAGLFSYVLVRRLLVYLSVTAVSFVHLQVGVARAQERFGPLRSSGQDAALDRVLSPPSLLKAFAPPPGTSFVGTPRLPGLGWDCFFWFRSSFLSRRTGADNFDRGIPP